MLVALAALFGAAITVAGCYATGALLLAGLRIRLKRPEKLPLAFVFGAACLHLMIFTVLTLRIAYKPVLLVLLAGLTAAAMRSGAWRLGAREKPLGRTLKAGFGIVFAAFTWLYFFNAWAPDSSPDTYHIEFIARYLRAHGFVRITTNMYAGLSGGVEMLYLPAFAFGRHSAAALVHLTFAIALALAIFAYGRSIGKPWVGAAAALITYASPILGRDTIGTYIDVAVAAIAFSAFYWVQLWDESHDARLLIPVGLLAGYAYAGKYTAFVMVPYALGFVAWRAKRLRPVLVVAAGAAVMMAPWMIKDWIYMHNPVAPMANSIFRNPVIHPMMERDWTTYLSRYEVKNKWELPIEVTLRGARTQGVIGLAFLAAPLALLSLRYRAGRRLLIPAFLLLATYLGNVGTRFLIPALPFFALSIALALGNSRTLLVLLVILQAVSSWPSGIRRYASPYTWRLDRIPYAAALRRIPQDRYLPGVMEVYEFARMIQANVPAGESVLTQSGGPQAYTSREILVGFQASSNQALEDLLLTALAEDCSPTRLLVFKFPERTVKRIRLLQTARGSGSQQWNVSELRFRHQGAELPRAPQWRLRAFPNPWDVQAAFDNSEVTRWRSWETAAPGMYMDVDFGQSEAVDEVDMQTSHDFEWPIRLQVESMDQSGRWIHVADHPEERAIPVRGSLRRAATKELAQRGIHYLAVSDGNWAADDLRDDPQAWGLVEVARTRVTNLYKVLP